MAGSIEKVIGEDGRFDFDEICDLDEAEEVCEELFKVVVELSDGDMGKVSEAAYQAGVPDPYCADRPEDDPLPMPMKRETQRDR